MPVAIANSEPGLDGCLAPSRSFQELAAVTHPDLSAIPCVAMFFDSTIIEERDALKLILIGQVRRFRLRS